jgi:hypothetical protein
LSHRCALETAALADVERWRRDPAALGDLKLGAFDEAPLVEVLARRLLLALRVPPFFVAFLTAATGRGAQELRESYRYWCGVRRAVDGDTWRCLTRGTTILMYHAVANEGEGPRRLIVSPDSLARQLRWLARRRPVRWRSPSTTATPPA